MGVIPGGRFLMGSELYPREQPMHPVRVDTAVAVGRFETTFDEWDACVRGGGCIYNSAPSDEGWGRGRRPVINVSWNDAKDYVSWLSRKTGKTYRLLTEAEWEYAARAGSTTTGNKTDCGKASYDGGRGSDCAAHTGWWSLRGTQSIGSYSANRWGLHDMLGNVWEWCEDNWHPDYREAPDDGAAWRGGDASTRILRGGAWNYSPSGLALPTETGFLPTGALFSSACVSPDSPMLDRRNQKWRCSMIETVIEAQLSRVERECAAITSALLRPRCRQAWC
jgi:formylglycine-generating enzyme required for sulfatase activity